MGSKGMTWDAETDRKLFLGIIKTHNISVDYEAMAAYMTTDDQKCTVEALKTRMKKLRAMAKDTPVDNGDATPKGRTRKRDASSDADEDTPAKKAKPRKKKAGRKAKAIQVEDGDDETGRVAIKDEGEDEDSA